MYKKIVLVCLSTLLFICGCNNNTSSINITSEVSEEDGILKNNLKKLNVNGYIGTNLKNNIKYWQSTAYKNNPNIISQISLANQTNAKTSLSSILGNDYFNVDSYYNIDVVEKENTKYIGWTMNFLPNTFSDRDFRFCNDPLAICSWDNAKELWIKVDNSEIDGVTSLRVAFEDDSNGRESYCLIDGKSVSLYNDSSVKEVIVKDNGYVDIPGNYIGYLALPLNNDYFSCYWCEGGNRIVDLNNVVQFQLSVKGTTENINKTFYMNGFSIVGDFLGNELPIQSDSTYKLKEIWNINNLDKKNKDNSLQSSSLPWYGEFVGKLLTGIAFSYKVNNDESLLNAANSIINDLEIAQGEDGYLGIFKGGARYSISSSNWDLWNQYHCIVGLLEWYKITGNEKAYSIAKKAIDCIYDTFQGKSYLVNGGFETNRGIAHAYALMYQVSKDKKYLDEAETIINRDCQDPRGWYFNALNGLSFYNSSSPRWEVLHMIMTLGILYQETKDEEYYYIMNYIYEDILKTDIHNTGGFTTNEAATGNPYKEGVIETCCTIAWEAFATEFYKISKRVDVIDELERTYFNGMLGSLLDNDKYCTYNTPVNGVQGSCGSYDGRRVQSQQDISFQFNSGSPDMNCCQANLARGLGQLCEWAILNDGNSLYLNYYGNANIETLINNQKVKIQQITDYPLNGKIKLKISGLDRPTNFSLNLRIPSWSNNNSVMFDGKNVTMESNKYYEINKLWDNDDEVELNLDLHFTCWKGESNQKGYSSIYYGPILLALDNYYLSNSNSTINFDRQIEIPNDEFKNAEVKNGNIDGAWVFVDIPYNDTFIRLVDFASCGKYNGQSQPSSYYSWLNIKNAPNNEFDDIINRWKVPLY